MKRSPLKRSNISSRSTSERKRLEDKADALWQRAIRIMWMGHCPLCAKDVVLADNEGCGHHINGCADKQTRHCLQNGIFLCHNHHVPFAHEYPHAFILWLKQDWPIFYDWHIKHKNLPPQRVSAIDLETTIEGLKVFIKENS